MWDIYIPPNDSDYFKDQFKLLDSLTKDAHENNEKLIIFGDLSFRIGVVDHFKGEVHSFSKILYAKRLKK